LCHVWAHLCQKAVCERKHHRPRISQLKRPNRTRGTLGPSSARICDTTQPERGEMSASPPVGRGIILGRQGSYDGVVWFTARRFVCPICGLRRRMAFVQERALVKTIVKPETLAVSLSLFLLRVNVIAAQVAKEQSLVNHRPCTPA
jgi:hypothetical protein